MKLLAKTKKPRGSVFTRYLICLSAGLFSISLQAATFTVNDGGDPDVGDPSQCIQQGICTLRDAFAAAELDQSIDSIEFDLAADIHVKRPLSANYPIIIDGGADKTVIRISQSYEVRYEEGAAILVAEFVDPSPGGFGTPLLGLLGDQSRVENIVLDGSIAVRPGEQAPTYVERTFGPRRLPLDGDKMIVAIGGIYVDNYLGQFPVSVTLTMNEVRYFGGAGILLLNTAGARIEGNVISGAVGQRGFSGDGIVIFGSPYGTRIVDNQVLGYRTALSVQFARDVEITGNEIALNKTGVEVRQVSGGGLFNNQIHDNSAAGIAIVQAENIVGSENLINSNGSYQFGEGGISVSGAYNVELAGNTIGQNRGSGILITGTEGSVAGAKIHNNQLPGNYYGIMLFPFEPLLQNVITNNRVIGSLQDGILNFGLHGDNFNLEVKENTVENSGATGISFIGGGSDIALVGNSVSENQNGIVMLAGYDDGQFHLEGILENITVSQNRATANLRNGINVRGVAGMELNTVADNTVVGNGGTGLSFSDASQFEVAGNLIGGNFGDGLAIYQGSAHFNISNNIIGLDGDGMANGNAGSGVYLGTRVSVTNDGFPVNMMSLAGPREIVLSDNRVAFNQGSGVLAGSDLDDVVRYFCEGLPCAGISEEAYIEDGAAQFVLLGNQIYANADSEIDLSSLYQVVSNGLASYVGVVTDGHDQNDRGDHDGFEKANTLQNYPVLKEASLQGKGNHLNMKIDLDTVPGIYRIDFFAATPESLASEPGAQYKLGHVIVSNSDAENECGLEVESSKRNVVIRGDQNDTLTPSMLTELSAVSVTTTATAMVFDNNCELKGVRTSELSRAVTLNTKR